MEPVAEGKSQWSPSPRDTAFLSCYPTVNGNLKFHKMSKFHTGKTECSFTFRMLGVLVLFGFFWFGFGLFVGFFFTVMPFKFYHREKFECLSLKMSFK